MPYCLYLRKSRKDIEAEAHGEGETLARHEKLLLELARRGCYNVTKIYREVVSGETIASRPVMQQLLQDVEAGLWEGVLVVEVDRLARGDTIDQGIMSQTFKYSGTKIITPLKVYDPENEYDEEYFEFGLFMSRREFKTINRRLIRGRLASAKEGKWVSGVAPCGYERVRVENGKGWTLRPVEAEADVVRLIFRLYTTGEEMPDGSCRRYGVRRLAIHLDELGVPPPRGAPYWVDSSVTFLLKNPVYIGKLRWNVHKRKKRLINNTVRVEHYTAPADEQVLVDGLHPAIIEEEVFQQAQDLIARNGPSPVQWTNVLANPLAGVLVCGLCGSRIILRKNKYGGVLLCRNRNCNNIGAKADVVEARLLDGLSQWLGEYGVSLSGPLAGEEEELGVLRRSVAAAEAELEKLHRQLSRSHDLLEQGVYDTDTFLDRSRELSGRITAAENALAARSDELTEAEVRASSRANIVPKVEHLLEVYSSLPSVQAKNDMLKEVLDRVEYVRRERSYRNGPFDNFELTIFPKLPPLKKE